MTSLTETVTPNYRVKLCVTPNILSVSNPDREIVELYNSKITKLANTRFSNKHPDSGFDLFVPDTVTIEARKIKLIDMKVSCSVSKVIKSATVGAVHQYEPTAYYMYARSSVSKRGIMLANSVGIIDSGYRGTLKAAFFNSTDNPVTIGKGDRVVQVCMPGLDYNFTVEVVNSLEETERGAGGIGSTGR